MKWSAVAALCLISTACGTADDDTRSPLVPVQATSYATLPPVTTPPPTASPPTTTLPAAGAIDPNEQQYTVVANDSESKIAALYGITVEQLYDYNEWPAEPRHTFQVDDIVLIPPNAKVPATPAAGAGGSITTSTAPVEVGCRHTVVDGDNQGNVADQYDVPLDALASANAGNPAWNHFQLGSEIIIPGGGDCP